MVQRLPSSPGCADGRGSLGRPGARPGRSRGSGCLAWPVAGGPPSGRQLPTVRHWRAIGRTPTALAHG
eukprot:10846792-Alexandrium_andersonii.AAC.1